MSSSCIFSVLSELGYLASSIMLVSSLGCCYMPNRVQGRVGPESGRDPPQCADMASVGGTTVLTQLSVQYFKPWVMRASSHELGKSCSGGENSGIQWEGYFIN